ncbi:TPA: hypothetical protein HA338_04810 [Methanosarcina acetivorans]|uniref:Uncharacterized protein n=2 Tax=Methanosarcina acetivorans TaxID=2214 RepID=Q8TM07_METAC|nr:hypothetical protein [Methanosarcina acetivorans]AAM06242.1 predicted protein [Methanosarcina acetivorans C2A]HIH93373.1 hypothetical protein [Methanosarcina acetivorans]
MLTVCICASTWDGGGAYTGDTILLRLFLEGEHNEEVRLEFVEAESTGLLDWEMFRDFNMIPAYLQLVKPVLYRCLLKMICSETYIVIISRPLKPDSSFSA